MSKINLPSVVIVFAIIITALFHKQSLGLNLFIAESLFIIAIIAIKQFQFKGFYPISLTVGLIVSSIITIITHSTFSFIMNFIVLFVFIGLLAYPRTKSLINAIGHSYINLISAQIAFLTKISRTKLKGKKLGNTLWKVRIFIIPILIILLFIFIYRKSNQAFDNIMSNAITFIQDKWNLIFSDIDFAIIGTFFICLLISTFAFIHKAVKEIIDSDSTSSDELKRIKKREKRAFNLNSLINEYKSGIFLLVTLNLMILLFNILDIVWVWFGFEWDGQTLKQFVHEGTYLLILSILISIALVLYYFRGNLNFYTKNKTLKYLSYIWLAQNGVLAISVGVRNFWYINHFALAYKRIGVFIFLILTLYGLYTVLVKVMHKKSKFYLFRKNTFATLMVLLIFSFINWDSLITKYNFAHADKSFIHLDFLANMSDKALPYADIPKDALIKIDSIQKGAFKLDHEFMTPEKYLKVIDERKQQFLIDWESKSILEWNLAEYQAYKKLSD